MIREGYKRLGEYIEPVDERNSTLSVKLSQGICNNKYFITPRQVAENSANDKIVRKGQFAYNRATTRNGDKISIAYREGDDCTVSSAYQVFRIIDEDKLNPHYLWMWFRRPEFDRYARFKSRGSAHEFFEWDEMCDVYLPIPDIDIQRRIVKEYQAVEARIHANDRMIEKLEETLDCLFNEKVSSFLGAEILPTEWKKSNLPGIADFLNGIACQKFEPENDEPYYPVIKIREMGIGDTDVMSDRASTCIPAKYVIRKGDLLFSWSASLTVGIWCGQNGALNQHIFKVLPKHCPKWFCYSWIKHYLEQWNNFISAKATSMGHLKQEDLSNADVIVPSKKDLMNLDKLFSPVFDYLIATKKEQLLLDNLRKTLLARLSN